MNTKTILMLCIFVIICLVITPLMFAETFEQASQIDFKKSCTNADSQQCSSSAQCNLSIRYPLNNSYVVSNVAMGNGVNGIFNYTLSPMQTNILGKYGWDMFCCDSGECGEAHGDFQVTKTGVELSQDKALVYVAMLVLLVFLFILSLVVIPMFPTDDYQEGELVSINQLKYLKPVMIVLAWVLLIAINFVSANISYLYLETKMMGDLFFTFFRIMLGLTFPALIFWFIWILSSILRDKEFKKMIERGVGIGGNL